MEADVVVIALGTNPNPLVPRTTYGLEVDRARLHRRRPADRRDQPPRRYAGGDIVTGAATVILAMGAGRKAAGTMHEYLQQRAVADEREARVPGGDAGTGSSGPATTRRLPSCATSWRTSSRARAATLTADHSLCDFASAREHRRPPASAITTIRSGEALSPEPRRSWTPSRRAREM